MGRTAIEDSFFALKFWFSGPYRNSALLRHRWYNSSKRIIAFLASVVKTRTEGVLTNIVASDIIGEEVGTAMGYAAAGIEKLQGGEVI
jgi:hypothetical protein